MRTLIWLMLFASAWSYAADKNVTLNPIITKTDHVLKVCQDTESTGRSDSAIRGLDPAAWLAGYFQDNKNKVVNEASIKTSLMESATRGKITSEISHDDSLIPQPDYVVYRYVPDPGYLGDDRAVFMAEFEGKHYKIIIDLHVFPIVDQHTPTTCPKPKLIKVTPAKQN